jgi:hypothetical protein
VYPIGFVHGKLRQFAKPRELTSLAYYYRDSARRAEEMIEQKVMNIQRKGNYAHSNNLFSTRSAKALCLP